MRASVLPNCPDPKPCLAPILDVTMCRSCVHLHRLYRRLGQGPAVYQGKSEQHESTTRVMVLVGPSDKRPIAGSAWRLGRGLQISPGMTTGPRSNQAGCQGMGRRAPSGLAAGRQQGPRRRLQVKAKVFKISGLIFLQAAVAIAAQSQHDQTLRAEK